MPANTTDYTRLNKVWEMEEAMKEARKAQLAAIDEILSDSMNRELEARTKPKKQVIQELTDEFNNTVTALNGQPIDCTDLLKAELQNIFSDYRKRPTPKAKAAAKAAPTPKATPKAAPKAAPTPKPAPKPAPTPEPTPAPKPAPTHTPKNYYYPDLKRRCNRCPPSTPTTIYHQALGVNWNYQMSAVRRAFLKKSLAHHPDKGGDAAAFILIKEAYEWIKKVNNDWRCMQKVNNGWRVADCSNGFPQ